MNIKVKDTKSASGLNDCEESKLGPKAALIPVFIMMHPFITKWGNYSTFEIPTGVLKDIQQVWES